MLASLALLAVCASPPDAPLLRSPGPGTLGDFVAEGTVVVGDDGVRLGKGRLRSARTIDGDLDVRLRVARLSGTPTFTLRLDGDLSLTLRLSDPPEAVLRAGGTERRAPLLGGAEIRLLVRSEAAEVREDGAARVWAVGRRPLNGGWLEVAVEGGGVLLSALDVRRLPFRDEVDIVGVDDAALRALEDRPREDFRLLDPAPGRIDPVFRLAVAAADGGAETRFEVRVTGLRPPRDEIPLLDQALAYAGIRPYLSCRLLVGPKGKEHEAPGRQRLGPFEARNGERAVLLCRALLGLRGEWASVMLRDPDRDRVLDRIVPGGPASRELWAELAPGTTRVEIVIARPGREPIVREVVVRWR